MNTILRTIRMPFRRSRTLRALLTSLVVLGTVVGLSSPAFADDVWRQSCSGYSGNFMVCVSYDWTSGEIAVNAYNNNASDWALADATLYVRVTQGSTGGVPLASARSNSETFWGQSWMGEPLLWGKPSPGTNKWVCGFLDDNGGQIVQGQCAQFVNP